MKKILKIQRKLDQFDRKTGTYAAIEGEVDPVPRIVEVVQVFEEFLDKWGRTADEGTYLNHRIWLFL